MFLNSDTFANHLVSQVLYLTELLIGYFLEMAEVEAEAVRRNQRTLLFYVCAKHCTQTVVEDMSSSVVALQCSTLLRVDLCNDRSSDILRQLLYDMYSQVVLTLGVDDLDDLIAENKDTLVADLATHLTIEWSLFEYDLVESLVLLLDLTIAEYLGLSFGEVITNELCSASMKLYPVAILYSSSITSALFLSLHVSLEAFLVDGHAILTSDELGEIERETVGVEQSKCLLAVDNSLASFLGVGHDSIHTLNAIFEGAEEAVLLFLDDTYDKLILSLKLWISITHSLDENWQKLIEESFLLSEVSICVTYGTTEDTTDHVTGLGIRRQLAICNSE